MLVFEMFSLPFSGRGRDPVWGACFFPVWVASHFPTISNVFVFTMETLPFPARPADSVFPPPQNCLFLQWKRAFSGATCCAVPIFHFPGLSKGVVEQRETLTFPFVDDFLHIFFRKSPIRGGRKGERFPLFYNGF